MKIQAFRQIESTLTENDIRLVFISNSTPAQTTEFLEITTVPVCGDLYSDPQLHLYKLFSLKRGRFRSLVMPIVSGLRKYGMRGVTEGIKLGYETGHLAGDSWQQGGTVILDTEANIKYVHVEEHPADWPDMEKVLPLMGIQNTSIDYKKAVNDWLKAREESTSKS
ncbi:peroxiredoxin-like 2C [Mytilus trossulus]|uniref:peroxiredoxin-like 2C n=1 Tax=Mytilus trossulus TaxID=6551 RepID=UPI003005D83D